MNEELKSVVKYCAVNKLSINFSKTNYILVSSSRLNESINVSNIKIKSQIKYLGVYVDQSILDHGIFTIFLSLIIRKCMTRMEV